MTSPRFYLLSAFLFVYSAACRAVETHEPTSISVSTASKPVLSGSTSVEVDIPTKHYEAGMKALENRLYKSAEKHLGQAWIEFRKNAKYAEIELLSRMALAEVYIATERFDQAKHMLVPAAHEFSRRFGQESLETGRLYYDLALVAYNQGDLTKAKSCAERSLSIRQKIFGAEHHDTGLVFSILAAIETAQGLPEDAVSNYKKALKALEVHPGTDRMDYADTLYGLAMVTHKLGEEEEAKRLVENASAIKGLAVRFDKTPAQKGLVKFVWHDGMPGSRQIADPTYPLKYMMVNKLRVACTAVRSDKHTAVLISLANCGKTPIRLAVGPVSFEKIQPSHGFLTFCDPALLDMALEEERVSDRTWRRSWLRHILKTRRIPGYLRNGELDSENFLGNNLFGLYGNWNVNLVDAPPVVTREQFVFDQKQVPYDIDLLGFMRGSSTDIRPTLIAPGDARTGLLLFLRQRYETAVVNITLGNVLVQLPFRAALGE